MQLALNKAWEYQGLTYPNPAVAAAITYKGRLVSVEAHQKSGSSHAEVLALLAAYESISHQSIDFDRYDAAKSHTFLLSLPQKFFSECTIYVTLEPCAHKGKTPSCASLLESLHLLRVVIGIKDPVAGHDGGAKKLENVSFGVLEEKCQTLIEPFLIWQKRAFVLFKLAQTTNGRIGGGYLSSQASLKHVHQLREVCDMLLIGGNTVRVDRPTLDSRFTGGKAPDITIYSGAKIFDKEIALFSVKERNVTITENLNFLDKPSFVLVEGGNGMLNALKEKIDWMLIYQTPKLSANNLTYNTTMNLEFLHQTRKDVDLMIWSRQSGH